MPSASESVDCHCRCNLLNDRQQLLKHGKSTSGTWTIITGAPLGFELSPLLFSLYTNCCISRDLSIKLLTNFNKVADDITVTGLIPDSVNLHKEGRLKIWQWNWLRPSWGTPKHSSSTIPDSTVPTMVSFKVPGLYLTGSKVRIPPGFPWKKLSKGFVFFANWTSVTHHRSCWPSSTQLSSNLFCTLQ